PGGQSPSLVGFMKPDARPISFDLSQRAITVKELTDFVLKGDFVTRSLNMLFLHAQGSLRPPNPLHATWQEIFGQPAFYPPPDTNPLSRNWKAPETPPPPSQG